MVLEHAWRMFQRGGEQEERTLCPPHRPSALRYPTRPTLAELGIAQQAVPLLVLSHVSHTPLLTAGDRGEDDAMPEPLSSLLSTLPVLISSNFQPPSWLGSAGEEEIVLPFAHLML